MILVFACTRPVPAPPCPDGMVHIEGGHLQLGEPEDTDRYKGGWIPRHAVELEDFCIDSYPFPGRKGAPWPSDGLTWDGLVILEGELARYGRRPCSISELMRAAAGPENRRYPTDAPKWDRQRCETNDHSPQPLGSFPRCRTPEGIYDFQVRSTWGALDEPTKQAFLDRWPPEDLWFDTWAVWGGTARTDTFYAPNNYGIHFHGPGVAQFEDDNFRVCADPGATTVSGYGDWLDAFIAAKSYGSGLLGSPG